MCELYGTLSIYSVKINTVELKFTDFHKWSEDTYVLILHYFLFFFMYKCLKFKF